jgi:hypothetical protein
VAREEAVKRAVQAGEVDARNLEGINAIRKGVQKVSVIITLKGLNYVIFTNRQLLTYALAVAVTMKMKKALREQIFVKWLEKQKRRRKEKDLEQLRCM